MQSEVSQRGAVVEMDFVDWVIQRSRGTKFDEGSEVDARDEKIYSFTVIESIRLRYIVKPSPGASRNGARRDGREPQVVFEWLDVPSGAKAAIYRKIARDQQGELLARRKRGNRIAAIMLPSIQVTLWDDLLCGVRRFT